MRKRASAIIAAGQTTRGRPKQSFAAEMEKPKPDPPTNLMTMSVEQMAIELGISRVTAYHLAQQSDFPSFTIGKRIRISRDGLTKWIEKQHTDKNPEILQPLEK